MSEPRSARRGRAADDHPAEEQLRAPWSRSSRPIARRIVQPLQAFLAAETSSGVVLLLAGAAALVWAAAGGSATTKTELGVDRWALRESNPPGGLIA
jgi:hypothetical protein